LYPKGKNKIRIFLGISEFLRTFASVQTVPFHIAYLLIRHECVIVPGLGAFVVSSSEGEKNYRWGILSPPESFLGFNPEIKQNDGLLAGSIAKEKELSAEDANRLIEQYVTYLLYSLDKGKRVQIPGVGILYAKDNKKVFQPSRALSCNALNYGLSSFSLPYANDLQIEALNSPPKKNKEVVWIPVSRKFISYCGSVAAALLVMCFIPTPLNNGRFFPKRTQYASLVGLSSRNPVEEEITASVSEEIQIPADTPLIQKEIKTSPPAKPEIRPIRKAAFHYYIIIASLPDRASANKVLTGFQSKFKEATLLYSDGRYRIYTRRFEDKAEAETFLARFRKNHPERKDAWLLAQKDKD